MLNKCDGHERQRSVVGWTTWPAIACKRMAFSVHIIVKTARAVRDRRPFLSCQVFQNSVLRGHRFDFK